MAGATAGSDLALVLPAYNEEHRLPAALGRLSDLAERSGLRLQVVVADDGSRDATRDIARRWSQYAGDDRFHVDLVELAHGGKGAAVRAGIGHVDAPIVGYCDVDLSAGPDAIALLYEKVQEGPDMVMGSRGLPDSIIEVHQRWYRELAGKTFNLILRKLVGLPYRDTQCGLKLFRREAAMVLFAHQQVNGFAFDAEIVMLAYRLGYRIEEVPIRWAHVEESKVSMFGDSLRMLWDVLRVSRRLKRSG